MNAPAPAYLVTGPDPVLVSRAVTELVAEVSGPGDDPALGVEHFDDDYDCGSLVEAARTPSFLGGRRVVVGRGVGQFSTSQLRPLLEYLEAPHADATLILVHDGGGRLAPGLGQAVKAVGEQLKVGVPHDKRGANQWWSEQLAASAVRLDRAAARRLRTHLGDDAGRLGGVLDVLSATFGNAPITEADLDPFLGEAGAVKPWDLTDAIDRGDRAEALDALARLRDAGGMHGLQLLAILHTHIARAMALDGSGAGDERGAAAHLGMTGSSFPAGKALALSRRLGSEGIRSALDALADADLAIRGLRDFGGADLTARTAVEMAVLRMCELTARS